MKKIFLTLILFAALFTQGFAQDATEKTTLQKVREIIDEEVTPRLNALGESQSSPDSPKDIEQDAKLVTIEAYVQQILETLNSGINPFVITPVLSVTDTSYNSVALSWTGSYDSVAIYVENTNSDPPTVPYDYFTGNSTTISNLSGQTLYRFWAQGIVGSNSSTSSNILSITTLPTPAFTPDLTGILSGNALADYSLRTTEGSGTFTIENNSYKLYYDSTSTFHESNYGQKTFTAQSDSVFVGLTVNPPSSVTMFNTSDEHIIASVYDTVASQFALGFGIDDSDGNRSGDRWYLRYRASGSNIEAFSTTAFNLITDKDIKIAWRDLGAGSGTIKVFINDTLVFNISSLDLTAYSPNALRIGNDDGINVNDYSVHSTWYYDNVYANSTGFGGTGTGEMPSGGGTSSDLGTYFVDYEYGNDFWDGRTTGTAFKNYPDDSKATGISASTTIASGDTIVFKGGVEYLGQFAPTSGVTYRSDYRWGNGKAIFNLQNIREYAVQGNADDIKIERIAFYNWDNGGSNYVIYPLIGSTNWDIDSCVFGFVEGWDNPNLMPNKPFALFTNSTTGHSITNSEFVAFGQTGIRLRYTSDINILGNNVGGISRGDSTGWFSVFVRGEVNSSNIKIKHNSVHDGWQYGGNVYPELNHAPAYIHVYGDASYLPRGYEIDSNYFYNDLQIYQGTGTSDIEITTNCRDFKIRGNVSANLLTHNTGNVLLSNFCDSILVENNTFIIRDYSGTVSGEIISGITIYTATTNTVGDSVWVRNNIFYNDNNMLQSYGVRLTGSSASFNGIIDYNAYINLDTINFYSTSGAVNLATWQGYGHDTNSLFYTENSTTKSYFTDFPALPVNTSSGDYSLSSSAPTFWKSGGYAGVTIGAFIYP